MVVLECLLYVLVDLRKTFKLIVVADKLRTAYSFSFLALFVYYAIYFIITISWLAELAL